MLVRLAVAWIDPAGVIHGAGEHVDIDAVTLAELEEQGVVENMTEPTEKQDWHGPDGTEPTAETDWHGPDGTTTQSETTTESEEGDWHGPDEETGN